MRASAAGGCCANYAAFTRTFDRIDPSAHDLGAPAVEEIACPDSGVVGPEDVELFAEQDRSTGTKIGSKDVAELGVLGGGAVLGSAQDCPTAPGTTPATFSPKLASFSRRASSMACSDWRRCGTGAAHGRLPASLADGAKIRLPHITAHKPESSDPFLAEPCEEGVDGGQRSMLSNPDQTAHADTRSDRPASGRFGGIPLNLVNSDGSIPE
jgi:hypothetical protein